MFNTKNSFNVLYTANIDKTANFFENLGVSLEERDKEKVVVKFGSFDLHYILNTAEPFQEYMYIATPNGYGQGLIFYIETNNIESALSKIQEAGGAIKSSIFENKWGCKEFLAEDPNGYKFAFYQAS
jgi:predicted enzyme related to lactoylglutathione lyase